MVALPMMAMRILVEARLNVVVALLLNDVTYGAGIHFGEGVEKDRLQGSVENRRLGGLVRTVFHNQSSVACNGRHLSPLRFCLS